MTESTITTVIRTAVFKKWKSNERTPRRIVTRNFNSCIKKQRFSYAILQAYNCPTHIKETHNKYSLFNSVALNKYNPPIKMCALRN